MTVPKGASCVVMSPMVHRDPELYIDPETFRPVRFLEENKSDDNYAFLAFSAGRPIIGSTPAHKKRSESRLRIRLGAQILERAPLWMRRLPLVPPSSGRAIIGRFTVIVTQLEVKNPHHRPSAICEQMVEYKPTVKAVLFQPQGNPGHNTQRFAIIPA